MERGGKYIKAFIGTVGRGGRDLKYFKAEALISRGGVGVGMGMGLNHNKFSIFLSIKINEVSLVLPLDDIQILPSKIFLHSVTPGEAILMFIIMSAEE